MLVHIRHFFRQAAFHLFGSVLFADQSDLLFERLVLKSQTRATRNHYKVDVPRFRYAPFKKSFAYRAANIWNNLSNDVRGKGSFKDFKDSIHENMMNKITFGSLATGRSQLNRDFIYY